MEAKDYVKARRDFFNSQLKNYLPAPGQCPQVLLEAMAYSLFAGGKRLRPILVLAAAEACGADPAPVLPAAAALEMVHTYSLIHDDLPAMDDDDLRRGKPTCHKVWGEGLAILAGDALLTHAFFLLAQIPGIKAETRLALVAELAAAAGPLGMVAGQALDIQNLEMDSPLLRRIHGAKTGALFRAALRLGGIFAGAPAETLAALSAYADHLGLAYQVLDDILDVTASSAVLGKPVGSDQRQNKESFVTVLGLEESRKLAAAETEAALAALSPLSASFQLLAELAVFFGRREN